MAAAGGGGGGGGGGWEAFSKFLATVPGQIIKAGVNEGVKGFASRVAGNRTLIEGEALSEMAGNGRIINARNRGDIRALARAMANYGAGESAGAAAPAVLETPPRVSAAAGAPAVLATPPRGAAAAAAAAAGSLFGFATPPRVSAGAGFATPPRVFGEARIMGPPLPRGKAAGSGSGQGWAYNYRRPKSDIEMYEGIMREFATIQEKKSLIKSVDYPLILKDGIPDIDTYHGRIFFGDRNIQYKLDKIFERVLDRGRNRGRSRSRDRSGHREGSRSRSRSGHRAGRKSGGTGKSHGGGLKGVNKRTNRTRRRNK